MSEEGTEDMSCPDNEEGRYVRVAPPVIGPVTGPRPLDQLRAERGLTDDLDDDVQQPTNLSVAARRRWLRARMKPGDEIAATRSTKDLDALAARLFRVDDRTIRRDRAYIRREQ